MIREPSPWISGHGHHWHCRLAGFIFPGCHTGQLFLRLLMGRWAGGWAEAVVMRGSRSVRMASSSRSWGGAKFGNIGSGLVFWRLSRSLALFSFWARARRSSKNLMLLRIESRRRKALFRHEARPGVFRPMQRAWASWACRRVGSASLSSLSLVSHMANCRVASS